MIKYHFSYKNIIPTLINIFESLRICIKFQLSKLQSYYQPTKTLKLTLKLTL